MVTCAAVAAACSLRCCWSASLTTVSTRTALSCQLWHASSVATALPLSSDRYTVLHIALFQYLSYSASKGGNLRKNNRVGGGAGQLTA